MPNELTGQQIDESIEDLPLDENFIEQAEYISEDVFLELSATHPEEESIIRRLSVGGAKLLVGPRGCGKTTLMLKAYYGLLRSKNSNTLDAYYCSMMQRMLFLRDNKKIFLNSSGK